RMLIERARRGLTVVRLKGGDPFIFGRGGEEAEALADAGVAFEVVPGVTTPLGIAAYCGVPLTHREHTSVVTFVTGHDIGAIDWEKVGASDTLVLFMGLTTLAAIAREMIARGRPPGTPAMAVRWATRSDQQTVVGTLATLPSLVKRAGMKPPATIVIGDVVRLREKLNWFEKLPLFGRRVVVTRARGQAGGLSARLHALGAEVLEAPAIAIEPADPQRLDAAIERLDTYDWLIFTSANGVRFFLEGLDRSRRDLRAMRGRLAAIGPATRSALERNHLKVDVMGEEYVAESLAGALPESLAGARILIPRAAVARQTLPEELRRRGADVDVVEAYRTVVPPDLGARAREIFGRSPKPDWITFTSSSTVAHFLAAAGAGALDGVRVASIGPVTTATAQRLGLPVDVEAGTYDVDGLVAAILTAADRRVESEGARRPADPGRGAGRVPARRRNHRGCAAGHHRVGAEPRATGVHGRRRDGGGLQRRNRRSAGELPRQGIDGIRHCHEVHAGAESRQVGGEGQDRRRDSPRVRATGGWRAAPGTSTRRAEAMRRVALLGGGPAGAFAAERLATAGVETVVFDEKLAWEKPCGGGLSAKAYRRYPFLIENDTPKKR
ncbi:MAG: uroporphyrinogen-III synthase, partial [Bryobacteraceae bacterium]